MLARPAYSSKPPLRTSAEELTAPGWRAPALAAVVSAAVLALLLAAVERRDRLLTLDGPVALWMQANRTPLEGHAGLLAAQATAPLAVLVLAVGFAVVLYRRGWGVAAAIVPAACLAAYAATGLLKVAVHRARPVAPVNLAPEAEPSFPSGHVSAITALAVVLLMLAWHRLTVAQRGVAVVVAVVAVLAVSLDRLLVGAHWFTDVAAGVALGCLVAFAVIAAWRWLSPRLPALAG